MVFRPDPKKRRIDLAPKEYHQLRLDVYKRCLHHCEICGFYMSFYEMSIHHKKSKGSGGDDSLENSLGCHIKCHPD